MNTPTDGTRWAYVNLRDEEHAWRTAWVLTPAARDDHVRIVINKPCKCGKCLGDIFSSWKYGAQRGPGYSGTTSLAQFSEWDRLIEEGAVTQDEKEIMVAMSSNEGNLDALQAYDSEALTAGAMQKTINSQGYGEFPIQVESFRQRHPGLYQTMFVECGWTVQDEPSGPRMYYDKKTGPELKALLRRDFKERFEGKRYSAPLNAVVHAISSKEFQTLQVKDFIDRLRYVVSIRPEGYRHRIGEYLHSKLGRAVALDHHINRPAHVSGDLSRALETFFAQNTQLSKDPGDWASDHARLEVELLEIYGPNRDMTEPTDRYQKLKGKL